MSTLLVSRDLTVLRAAACAEIDRRAEEIRLTEITPGAGQALTYEDKLREAQAVDADRDNIASMNAADYPFLQVDMTLESITLEAATDQVLNRYAAWKAMAVAIEEVRRGQKAHVNGSTDPTVIEAAPNAVTLAAVQALLAP